MNSILSPIVLAASSRWQSNSQAGDPACAVTVGNFDGVHLGHAVIIKQLLAMAHRLDMPAAAFTFDPHPATIVRPQTAPIPLSTPHRRAELLLSLGVDAVIVQPATKALMGLEAKIFYAEILRARLRARGIVEGPDFRFGANRTGDIALLAALCRADGVAIETVDPVLVDGEPVSSSRIRGLIASGNVSEAAALLTAPYRLSGRVIEGAKRGGPLGFPTANLAEIQTLLPAGGVYAARVTVAESRADTIVGVGGQKFWPAAVHIGPTLSFGGTVTTVEAHLIGYSGNLYGESLDIDFLQRLRETQKFGTIDELKSQLADDVASAARIAAVRSEP
ncbi:MAG: riboflavin biosynthesis protein RibF [Planctomycetota bacterium]